MATRRLMVPPAILGGPVVLLNATSSDGLPCVLPDDDRAGRAVATALLEHGHRDAIALIGRNRLKEGEPEISLAARARLRGIQQALGDAGVTLLTESFCTEWLPEHGYAATRALLNRPQRPSLATTALPHELMGRRAVELLLDGGAAEPSFVAMPLRRRRSLAPPAR
ncbi:hypothetical protein [Micromonospora sp. NPDC049102]|uniref:hypothetical protein n=1 Tax=Micromonospora sp. NPDC049102 TaxID=3364265 RepID=UPI0037183C2A